MLVRKLNDKDFIWKSSKEYVNHKKKFKPVLQDGNVSEEEQVQCGAGSGDVLS